MRLGDWKLHEYFEDGGLELYNLRNDIGETTNLAKQQPQKAAELLERLQIWRKAIAAPIPRQLNPEYDAEAEARAIAAKLESRQRRNAKRAAK